ncbi:SDR family oxidoreductase [Lacinutrix sp. Bg11-31]|uniref:SDR family oxidoreductase n=1 Tax=Lacinutrix sp. Bg11-31 TaxID=2057808 RepID=UPI000C312F26|nr:SDR family oxidoreductase [Lacinutrix sp. Bg11-31]AUC81668.1 short chain dehydrogenase/reductase, MupV family protein [Lacinutrix sp. Bg11-31]
MNCLLTGGTGIVGSHVIFDWLKQAITKNSKDHLYLVIRDSKLSAKKRLLNVLNNSTKPDYLKNISVEKCLEKITVIAEDLVSIKKEKLEACNFSTIIHCAGSTNLSHATNSKTVVHEQNYKATQQLLENLPESVNRFIYISTAYSFGIQNEVVNDNISEYNVSSFRNPYEQSKYETEQYVIKKCEEINIASQILRPSIICGRLIDKPFFETPKFDVFYSWPMFLDKYAKKFTDAFRIWIDKESGLNIVPVDFVSKAILYAVDHPEIKELNIVNPKQVLHKDYVGKVLESFQINNYEYIDKMPLDLNSFEALYYKTIGQLFKNYISIPDLQFDAKRIIEIINQLKLDTTLGVHDNFMNLINFSVEKEFRQSY